jgi:transposase InsO family protein
MDEKILFIADYLRDDVSDFSALCGRYGISRKTGYKWVQRYAATGMDGLAEQSRRPHHSPQAIPFAIRKAILRLRTETRITPGAKKIQVLLARQFPADLIPAQSSIYRILKQAGLTQPAKKRRRIRPFPQPFAPASAPNAVWSADYKGQLRLGNGQWCYPLTVMDHHSRYLLGCQGLKGTGLAGAKTQFIRLFQAYGLPQRIRTDNGVPFATRTAGGLSSLSIWWIKLGICPERICPGKPQQNGRHERMHSTLKKATATPPAKTQTEQQRRFEQFQREYNEQRPHEALAQQTPASCYTASPRPYPNRLPEITYPDYFQVRTVKPSGVIYKHSGQVYISHLLAGEPVGLEEIADGIWDVYFGHLRLGAFNLHQAKGKGTPYWTLKV